jgi:hypothetical protein
MAKSDKYTTGPKASDELMSAAKSAIEYGKKKHADFKRKKSEQKAASAKKVERGPEEEGGYKELSAAEVKDILGGPKKGAFTDEQTDKLNKELRRRNVEKIRGPKKEK